MNLTIDQAFARSRALLGERGLTPVYMAVKGSRLYGLPGTHKDTDVRAVHLARTVDALSITKPQHTIQITEGDLDFVSWEAERFFQHLLGHNGNMIEMLLAPNDLSWFGSEGRALRGVGSKFLTKRLHRYYAGFAANQLQRALHAKEGQARTGKNLLYLYREMYAGIALLRWGEIIFDWPQLRTLIEEPLPRIRPAMFISQVLSRVTMDRTTVEPALLRMASGELDVLMQMLADVRDTSPLPDDYKDAYEVCNRMLLLWRSKGWA